MSYYIQFILKRKRIGLHLLEGGMLKNFWKIFLKPPPVEILLPIFTPARCNWLPANLLAHISILCRFLVAMSVEMPHNAGWGASPQIEAVLTIPISHFIL